MIKKNIKTFEFIDVFILAIIKDFFYFYDIFEISIKP